MEVYRYSPLVGGILIRRVNRFVSEIVLNGDTNVVQAYMANPGSMLGMCVKGADIRASLAPPGSGKFKYRIEAIRIADVWIGCNTLIANKVVQKLLYGRHLIEQGILEDYDSFQHEVKDGNSRIDFVTQCLNTKTKTFIEVKTVTMASNWYDIEVSQTRADKPFHNFPTSRPEECNMSGDLIALFPDCESKRAQKHVEHLIQCAKRPDSRSVMLFVVVRNDVAAVAPSVHCDHSYAELLSQSMGQYVSCCALKFNLHLDDPENAYITLEGSIPVSTSRDSDPRCTKRVRIR